MHPAFPINNQGPNVGPAAPTTTTEDPELAMAIISASLQSSSVARPTAPATHVSSGSTPSAGSGDTTPHNKKTEKWETHDVGASSSASTCQNKPVDENKLGKVFYNLASSGNSKHIKDLHDYLSKQTSGWRAPLEVYFIPFFYFYILILCYTQPCYN